MKIFKTLRKRGLALFLVLVMCMGFLPATANAALSMSTVFPTNSGNLCIQKWDFDNPNHPNDYYYHWGTELGYDLSAVLPADLAAYYRDLDSPPPLGSDEIYKSYAVFRPTGSAVYFNNPYRLSLNCQPGGGVVLPVLGMTVDNVYPNIYLYHIDAIEGEEYVEGGRDGIECFYGGSQISQVWGGLTQFNGAVLRLFLTPEAKDKEIKIYLRTVFGYSHKWDYNQGKMAPWYCWEDVYTINGRGEVSVEPVMSHDLYIPAGQTATMSLSEYTGADSNTLCTLSSVGTSGGDSAVATVSSNKVTNNIDYVTIAAAANAEENATTQIYVNYQATNGGTAKQVRNVINVHIVKANEQSLNVGDTADITPQAGPEGATLSTKNASCTSSDRAVIKLENGETGHATATALKDGTATVTNKYQYNKRVASGGRYADQVTAYCDVTKYNVGLSGPVKTLVGDGLYKGVDATYEVKFTNNGSKAVTGVKITDALNSNLTFKKAEALIGDTVVGTWDSVPASSIYEIGEVAAGATVVLRITATVKSNASSSISNTATVAHDGNTAGTKSNTVTKTPQAMMSNITKALVDETSLYVGGKAIYELKVTNNSSEAVQNVKLVDTLSGSYTAALAYESATVKVGDGEEQPITRAETEGNVSTFVIPELGPKQTAVVRITFNVIDQTLATSTSFTSRTVYNTATGTYDYGDSPNLPLTASSKIQGSTASMLSTPSKTVSESLVTGGEGEYKITFKNQSKTQTAAGVKLRDILPEGLTFKSATVQVGEGVDKGEVRTITAQPEGSIYEIGELKPQEWVTVKIRVNVNTSNSVTNKAEVTYEGLNIWLLGTRQVTPTKPISSVTKTLVDSNGNTTDAYLYAGQKAIYKITFTNTHTTRAAENVKITDKLPDGLTFVSATLKVGNGAAAPITPDADGVYQVGKVGPNEAVELLITVNVTGGTTMGTSSYTRPTTGKSITNTASIDYTGLSAPITKSTSSTSVYSMLGTFTKTAPNGIYVAGESVYLIKFKNASTTQTATGVKVTDALPTGMTFKSAKFSIVNPNTNLDEANAQVIVPTGDVYAIGDVGPNQTVGLWITVETDPATIGSKAVTNTATLTYDGLNASLSASVSLTPKKRLTGVFKEVISADELPAGVTLPANVTVTPLNSDGTVTFPEGGAVTLLYKVTVTGDNGALYRLSDSGAMYIGPDAQTTVKGKANVTANGALKGTFNYAYGTIGESGQAVFYLYRTFTTATSSVLENTATVAANNNTTSYITSLGTNMAVVPSEEHTAKGGTHSSTTLSSTSSVTVKEAGAKYLTKIEKERINSLPDGMTLPDGVTIATLDETGKLTVPTDGKASLLYKITVSGDEGAKFTVSDSGDVGFVGPADAGYTATKGDAKLTVTGAVPAGGKAEIYVYKSFTAEDIAEDKVSNSASMAPNGDGTSLPNGVKDATDPVDTPAEAEEPAELPALKGITKTRVTGSLPEALTGSGVSANLTKPIDLTDSEKAGGKVTLLYAITVTGDEGAKFVVTDKVNGVAAVYVGNGSSLSVGADGLTLDAAAGTIAGAVPAGGSVTLYVTMEYAVAAGNFDNEAVLTAGEGSKIENPDGSAADSKKDSETSYRNIEVQKTKAKVTNTTDSEYINGDVVEYKVTVSNTTGRTLQGLEIRDVMDDGLALITDRTDENYKIKGKVDAAHKQDDNRLSVKYYSTSRTQIWKLDGKFVPGAVVTLTYRAKVTTSDAVQSLNNKVSASASLAVEPVQASAFNVPGIEILSKSAVWYAAPDDDGDDVGLEVDPTNPPPDPSGNPDVGKGDDESITVKKSYTVTFNPSGGGWNPGEDGVPTDTNSRNINVKENSAVAYPGNPVRLGYTFTGWKNGTENWEPSNPITGDTALTAQWTENPNVSVTKAPVEKEGGYIAGDTVQWNITVTNNGHESVSGLKVVDTLSGVTVAKATVNSVEVDPENFTLAGGASVTFIASLENALVGTHENGVKVQKDGKDITSEVKSSGVQVTSAPAPNLVVTKSANPANGVSVGKKLTYTITVSNNGGAAAHDVKVTDRVPAGLSLVFDSITGAKYDSDTRELTWSIGTLEKDADRTVSFQAVANSTSQITNSASVTYRESDQAVQSNSVATSIYKLIPSKGHEKPIAVDAATGTATIKYTVTVKNESGFDLYGLDIIDTLTPKITSGTATLELVPQSLTLTDKDDQKISDGVGVPGATTNPTATTGTSTPRTWEVLDRSTAFPDGSTAVLKYNIVVKNTSSTENLVITLDNTAKGGSWVSMNAAQPELQMLSANGGGKDYDADFETGDSAGVGTDSAQVVIPPVQELVDVFFDAGGGTWSDGSPGPKKVGQVAKGSTTIPDNLYPTEGPTAPQGKVFDKWSDPATGSDGSITVTALWKAPPIEPKRFTVTLTPTNGGETGAWTDGSASGTTKEFTVTEGGSITLPDITPPAGKVFAGWSEKQVPGEGDTIYGPGAAYTPSATATLYPIWEEDVPAEISYTVTYHSNNGEDKEIKDTVKSTDSYTTRLNSFTVPDGHKFGCWNTAADGSGTDYSANASLTLTSDLVLYAKWDVKSPDPTPEKVTVAWYNGVTGEQIGESKEFDKDAVIPMSEYPSVPFNEGYRFDRWEEADDGNGGIKITATYIQLIEAPDAPTYEYLRDTLGIKVNVICDTADSGHGQTGPVALKRGSYEAVPAGEGYNIVIYPDAYVSDLPGSHSTEFVEPQTIPLEYVATPEESSDVTEQPSEDVPNNDATLDDDPSKSGNIVSNDGQSESDDFTSVDIADNGVDSSSKEVDENTIDQADRSFYTAATGAWRIADGNNNVVTFHVSCQPEPQEPEKVTVIWQDANGNVLQTLEVAKGTDYASLPAPANPTAYGHWQSADTGSAVIIRWVDETPVTTYYTLTVRYLYENGTTAAAEVVRSYASGSSYSVVSPSIVGYTADRASVSGIMNGNVVETVTYTANVEPTPTITVTFVDGQSGNTIEVRPGLGQIPGESEYPNAPVHEGYNFTGWTTGTPDANGNVTITATYRPAEEPAEERAVTWVNWNGEFLYRDTFTNGEAEPSYVGAAPARPSDGVYYYTFTGWSAPVVDADGNITYTAQYTQTPVYYPDIDDPYYPPYTPDVPDTPATPATPGTTIPDNPSPLDPGTTITDQDVPLAGAVGLNDTDHFAYIAGYDDGTVRPLNNITRAEVATIFFRLMTEEYRVASWATENTFSDVNAGDWYNNAVSTCANAGIIKGYEDGTFRPNAPITRAEFAAIAARFLGSDANDEGTGDFADTADKWYSADVRKAAKAGWITGVGGNRFEPDANISRAQVMAIVNRMLDRTPDVEHMLPEMKTWTDNPEGTWYYVDVQEATNGHDHTRDETSAETWTAMQDKKDWAEIEAEWAANNGASAPNAEVETQGLPDGI